MPRARVASALLAERILERIRAEGPLTAADFMRMALYDPEEGYYARGPAIGAEGDFYTASNASLFPRALRRFVDDAVARLEGARVVELGGGAGALAASLGLPVTVVEPSPGLARRQREAGLEVVAALDRLDPAPTVFLANEVLDALPVHRVRKARGGLVELRVDARDGALVEVESPIHSPTLARRAAPLAAILPEGAAAEVCLEAEGLLAGMLRAAPRMIALFLDYGDARARLYGEARPDGTIRGFRAHRVTSWLDAPGAQDVTADVDFDLVRELAAEQGIAAAGFATQGEFLADLGLLDDMMRALERGDTEAYLAAKGLLMPGGMGERFHALALARGVPIAPPLAGFRRDIYPGASRR